MKAGNSLTADMITPRSKQENALTFSYGSHYPSLHRFLSLFIFTSSSAIPLSLSDFLLLVHFSFLFVMSVCMHVSLTPATCELFMSRHEVHKYTHLQEKGFDYQLVGLTFLFGSATV